MKKKKTKKKSTKVVKKRKCKYLTQASLLALVTKHKEIEVHAWDRIEFRTRKRLIQDDNLIQYRSHLDSQFVGLRSCFEKTISQGLLMPHKVNVKKSIERMFQYDKDHHLKITEIVVKGKTIWSRDPA